MTPMFQESLDQHFDILDGNRPMKISREEAKARTEPIVTWIAYDALIICKFPVFVYGR